MSYGYQPAPRRSGMTSTGKWMFLIGLVLSLIALAVTIWGGVQTVRAAQAVQQGTLSLSSPQSVSMEAGEARFVLVDSQEVSCTVTTPGGQTRTLNQEPLEGVEPDQSGLMLSSGYTAASAGQHTFACEGGQAELSGPLSSSVIIGGAALGLGLLALLPLGLITIVGLILWLVGRSRDQRAALAPAGGHGQPYGGPGYGAPPYPGQSAGSSPYPSDTPGWGQQGSGQPYGSGQGDERPYNPDDPYGTSPDRGEDKR